MIFTCQNIIRWNVQDGEKLPQVYRALGMDKPEAVAKVGMEPLELDAGCAGW